jgi:hypothetical protein
MNGKRWQPTVNGSDIVGTASGEELGDLDMREGTKDVGLGQVQVTEAPLVSCTM